MPMRRIGPENEPTFANPRKDLIELRLAHEKCVVLDDDLARLCPDEIQRDAIVKLDTHEGPERFRLAEPQNFRQESGGRYRIERMHDRVIEMDRHAAIVRATCGRMKLV